MLTVLKAKRETLEVEEKALYSEIEALEEKIKHVQAKIGLVDEMIAEEAVKSEPVVTNTNSISSNATTSGNGFMF